MGRIHWEPINLLCILVCKFNNESPRWESQRSLIFEFTNKDVEEIDDFAVNSLGCMVQDQSVNNTWKNLVGGLYDTFNKRKPSRQTMGGFMNDIQASFENLSQENIQNAIDIQPKVMEAIIAADGGHTTYMSSGSAKKGV